MRFLLYIIFEIAVLIFDIFGAYVNYTAGHYIWAMVLSFCTGVILSSVVTVTIEYFKR